MGMLGIHCAVQSFVDDLLDGVLASAKQILQHRKGKWNDRDIFQKIVKPKTYLNPSVETDTWKISTASLEQKSAWVISRRSLYY